MSRERGSREGLPWGQHGLTELGRRCGIGGPGPRGLADITGEGTGLTAVLNADTMVHGRCPEASLSGEPCLRRAGGKQKGGSGDRRDPE